MVNMEEAETLVNSVLSNLNDLSEDLGDTIKAAVGSPIKFIKVKNNLKKWAKFKLDMASVDMDAIRKKEAAGEDPKGVDKEKLETAVKSKKDAIHGKMDDINDRLNDLAVNDSLKAVVRLGKHKASLEANTKLLKIAQSEENDALKLKLEDQIESDKEAITNAEDQLKTYAKKAGNDTSTSKEDETNGNTGGVESSSDSEKERIAKSAEAAARKISDAKTAWDNAKEASGKIDDGDKKAKAEASVEEITKELEYFKIKGDKGQAAKQVIADIESELATAKEKLANIDTTEGDNEEGSATPSKEKGTPAQEKAKEKIVELKSKIDELSSKSDELKSKLDDAATKNEEAEAKLHNAKKDGKEDEIKTAEFEYADAVQKLKDAQNAKSNNDVTIKKHQDEIDTLTKDNNLKGSNEDSQESIPYSKAVTEAISVEISTKFRELMNKMK